MKNLLFSLLFITSFAFGQAGRPTASNPAFPATSGTVNIKLYGNVSYKPFTLSGNLIITHNTSNNVACVTKIRVIPKNNYSITVPVSWNCIGSKFDAQKESILIIKNNSNNIVDYYFISVKEKFIGRALSVFYNPNDSYSSSVSPTTLNTYAGNVLTIAMWAKTPTRPSNAVQQFVLTIGSQVSVSLYQNKMTLNTNFTDASYPYIKGNFIYNDQVFTIWAFYVFQISSTGECNIYLNGVDIADNINSFVGYSTIPPLLTTDRLVVAPHGSIKIDNLVFFNRYLSQSEVTEIYNGGKQIDYSTTTLSPYIAEYYKFDNTMNSEKTLNLAPINSKPILYIKDTPPEP